MSVDGFGLSNSPISPLALLVEWWFKVSLNIHFPKTLLKMILLFQQWDMKMMFVFQLMANDRDHLTSVGHSGRSWVYLDG